MGVPPPRGRDTINFMCSGSKVARSVYVCFVISGLRPWVHSFLVLIKQASCMSFCQSSVIRGFVTIVFVRGFVHPCQLFMARDVTKSSRMIFGCFIVRHCDELSSRGISFKSETWPFEFPSLPLRQKNRTTWNHTFWSKVRGLVSAMAWKVLSFFKSSSSIAGLCFTFSFPWRFKWTILAFSISFDLLKRGSELRFKPWLKGGLFRYLSKECLNPRRVDLPYGSPALFLASA